MRTGAKKLHSPTVQYWLMKSEPAKFSIDDLAKQKVSPWDGVRNYEARNNMQAMRVGDIVLFYHSMTKEPGVIGLAEVCREAYDDHTALDKKSEYYSAKATPAHNPWQMVDVRFVEKFARTVSLDEMKAAKELKDMALLQRQRLSVQPVSADEHACIVAMAHTPASASTEKGTARKRARTEA